MSTFFSLLVSVMMSLSAGDTNVANYQTEDDLIWPGSVNGKKDKTTPAETQPDIIWPGSANGKG
jgi:hypothetical protein